ncbi:MAG: PepSY domain-containing protein [Albidovulum sp.]
MIRLKTLAAATALALSFGLPALAGSAPDAAVQEKLTADLTAQGYEVRRLDTEDGLIEVYAIKDGKTYELYFDADLTLVRTKEGS